MSVLSDLDLLQIEMAAITACTERSDFDPMQAPGAQMTPNDYRAAIRQYYSEVEGWEEWMINPLLAEVQAHARLREAAEGACHLLMGALLR